MSPRQNGGQSYRYFQIHFIVRISRISAPKNPINNKPALIQKMVLRRIGDKPLSESMIDLFTEAYEILWYVYFVFNRGNAVLKEIFDT